MTEPDDPLKFNVELDYRAKVVTIQGIRYAFELFNGIGFAPLGSVFRIENRSDGVVTLTKLEGKD